MFVRDSCQSSAGIIGHQRQARQILTSIIDFQLKDNILVPYILAACYGRGHGKQNSKQEQNKDTLPPYLGIQSAHPTPPLIDLLRTDGNGNRPFGCFLDNVEISGEGHCMGLAFRDSGIKNAGIFKSEYRLGAF